MPFEQLFKERVPTPDQMLTLIKFVERGSLSHAFGSGKSAQAAATQQLGRIDRAMGIRTRKSAGIRKVPTAEGRELATLAREFFQKLDDFKRESMRAPNHFNVGAGDSLMFYLLIPALRRAGKWRRQVELQLQNLRSRDIVAGVLDNSLDLGLVRSSALEPQLLRAKRLHADELCSIEYAFFVRKELLSIKQTSEEATINWCMRNLPLANFWGELSTFTAALGRTRLKWPAQLRCESFPQVKEAVLFGDYCGILPLLAFRGGIPEEVIAFGHSSLAPAYRNVSLIWTSNLVERRNRGELALSELRTALHGVCGPSTGRVRPHSSI
ncbi:MAG TPA: LysR family transcriptional regulator [Opitutaceae bacterium]|jgi:DNA-binding transcriptional LysR family regulator|nr:LysR family transcriptional regulator [Opitutaceae bacterium]